MQHWLTVQHPPEKGHEQEPTNGGVWVRREHAASFKDITEGDQVLIYQTKSGPRRALHEPDGSVHRSRYHRGCGGVVSVGSVVEVTTDLPVTRAVQDDGEEIDWARLARLAVEQFPHPILALEVNQALGWSPRARMRGFGGLLRVTEQQFRTIVEAGKE